MAKGGKAKSQGQIKGPDLSTHASASMKKGRKKGMARSKGQIKGPELSKHASQ